MPRIPLNSAERRAGNPGARPHRVPQVIHRSRAISAPVKFTQLYERSGNCRVAASHYPSSPQPFHKGQKDHAAGRLRSAPVQAGDPPGPPHTTASGCHERAVNSQDPRPTLRRIGGSTAFLRESIPNCETGPNPWRSALFFSRVARVALALRACFSPGCRQISRLPTQLSIRRGGDPRAPRKVALFVVKSQLSRAIPGLGTIRSVGHPVILPTCDKMHRGA